MKKNSKKASVKIVSKAKTLLAKITNKSQKPVGAKAHPKLPPGIPLPLPKEKKKVGISLKKKAAVTAPVKVKSPKQVIAGKKAPIVVVKSRAKKSDNLQPKHRELAGTPPQQSLAPQPEPAYEPPPQPSFSEELPSQYGVNRIVLLARDPEWIFSYWEITPARLEEAQNFFGAEWEKTRSILRVYDVSQVEFNGHNAHAFFDIELKGNATNWYIHVGKPDCAFIVEIARISPSGKIFVLARSNVVRTPRLRPSGIVDEEWMSLDFEKLYGLCGGLRIGASSAEFRRMMEKGLPIGISSASGGLFSAGSPVKKKKQRGFWFVVDAELIVYGATEPDAKVTVQGKHVPLRPDGTFTLRFALPDGKKHIPATAESGDGIEERTIAIDVTRKTTQKAPILKEGVHA